MKTKTIFLLILVFISGGLIGSFLTGRSFKKRVHQIKEQRKPEVFREHLHDVLGTNDKQRHSIDSVMKIYLPRIKEARMKNHETIGAMHDSMLSEVRLFLNKEQEDKLMRFEKRFYRKHHHRHNGELKDHRK